MLLVLSYLPARLQFTVKLPLILDMLLVFSYLTARLQFTLKLPLILDMLLVFSYLPAEILDHRLFYGWQRKNLLAFFSAFVHFVLFTLLGDSKITKLYL